MRIRFYLICKFLCVSFLIKAQSNNNLITALQKEADGYYTEANVLYERVIFDDDNETNVLQSIKGKTRCYKKLNAFDKAADFLKANINLIATDAAKCNLFEDLILCTYLANNLDEAISLIKQTSLSYPQFINRNKLTLLHILSLNEQTKWKEAMVVYKDWLITAGKDSTNVESVYADIPQLKNKDKASWLATFIPGGGAFYTGKTEEGFASIALQAAGVLYGVYCFNTGYYISAILVGGGMAGSFHNGGVRRADELANQYNRKKATDYNKILREKILSAFQ